MRMVYCTFSVIGYHNYSKAPKEVAYLRSNHRHKFDFKVSVEVTHDNREIEFHMLRRDCLAILKTEFAHWDVEDEYEFEGRSCEMIADLILQRLLKADKYGATIVDISHGLPETHGRQIIIEVNEDRECGGVVSRY